MHIGIRVGGNGPLHSKALKLAFFHEHMTQITLSISITASLPQKSILATEYPSESTDTQSINYTIENNLLCHAFVATQLHIFLQVELNHHLADNCTFFME